MKPPPKKIIPLLNSIRLIEFQIGFNISKNLPIPYGWKIIMLFSFPSKFKLFQLIDFENTLVFLSDSIIKFEFLTIFVF